MRLWSRLFWLAPSLVTAELSRGLHFNCQSQTCAADLALKRKPYKLRFTLVEGFGKTSGPIWTDSSPLVSRNRSLEFLHKIAEMRSLNLRV